MDIDIQSSGDEDENDTTINNAILQICIEIEEQVGLNHNSEICISKWLCNICGKNFKTERGLKTHKSRSHSADLQNELLCNQDDVRKLWDECLNLPMMTYLELTATEKELDSNRLVIISNATKTKDRNSFAKEFLQILKMENNKKKKAILIELFNLIENRMSKLEAAPSDSSPKIEQVQYLDDTEKEVCYYIAGRVIRTLYFKTKNGFYKSLKDENTHRFGHKCWNINQSGAKIFEATEVICRNALKLQPTELDFASMAEEVMFQNNFSCSWSNNIEKQCTAMIEKYIRTRCHSYAKRLSQLFQEKLSQKRKKKHGKGARASFRTNLKNT